MSIESPEVEERWASWLVERNRRGLRACLLIIAIGFPIFGVLDWAVAPTAALPWLWAMRAVLALSAVTVFPLVSRVRSTALGEAIGVACALASALSISMMTTYLGGLASPYYAGLAIVFVAAGLLLVWHPRVVMVANASIVLIFVVANLATGQIGPVAVAFSNLTFLSIIGVITGLGQVVQFNTQREQIVQRVRLEQASAKLERAHAELRQLDDFKSRFFANMTHELRTPLTMILTPLELLLQGEMGQFSDAAASSFNSMYRSALKLLKLINDLLDLSRLEESRLRLYVNEHELVAYLRTLIEQTQLLARRRGITLAFRTMAERATLRCDLDRLERVFVNLLSNALKFTQSGGHVDVSLVTAEDEIEVVVQDDGPGFAPDRAEKLFERFYQVDMAGTREHGGAGIGLSLAREFVELHGGTIRAWSDGVRGARFTVKLLRNHSFRAEDLATPDTADSTPAGGGHLERTVQFERLKEFRLLDIDDATERRSVERDTDEAHRAYSVVVVEDNPQVLRVVHMALRREFKVFAAPDGLKGLELVARERPSLVVTDLMMPGIDGLELTRRLRDDPDTRHIPVLMLTARGALDDRVKGMEMGVSIYLTKPFSPRELITCARELVKAEEQTADLVLTRRMESIELVAAGLAHELNNPLNYVKASLLRVGMDVEQITALAGASHDRTLAATEVATLERLAARIKEMLTVAAAGLARIAGTVELLGRYGRAGFRRDLGPLDAWEAVRTVVDIVLPATGRRVDFDLQFSGDGTLECVPEEFNQVLTNLVQNAIEAVPTEGGRVRVSGRVEENDVILSVKDNGPGMPPDVQERLFTPFFTTKGPGRGMGLGLTIVRRVVQGLGGALHVVSTPGAGAEFIVRVPKHQRQQTTAALA